MDLRVFNYGRDIDPLNQNGKLIEAALDSILSKNGGGSVTIVNAQIYQGHHPTLQAAKTVLTQGSFDVFFAAQTSHDNSMYESVISDIGELVLLDPGLKDKAIMLAASGVPLDPFYTEELGFLQLARPNGYLQVTDKDFVRARVLALPHIASQNCSRASGYAGLTPQPTLH